MYEDPCHKKTRQRFGIEANKTDLDNIIEQIESGRAIFIEKQSNRVSAFLVELKDIKMAVIYDKQRNMVVTCLPPEYLESQGGS